MGVKIQNVDRSMSVEKISRISFKNTRYFLSGKLIFDYVKWSNYPYVFNETKRIASELRWQS